MTNADETARVNEMALKHPEISLEIEEISKALEIDAESKMYKPSQTVKPFIMAIVDYTERLKNGEQMTFPPLLSRESKIIDFAEWTTRADMILPDDADNLYAKLIGHNSEATTAISWLRTHSPVEIHTTELERFLILEGSCDITIGNEVHSLVAGDFLAIPLHIEHSLVVTSQIPCKVILQRVAA
ncbi:MAG: cupin domain-containing protein [Burkholderiales bacterium]|nr:cupin domain-containing protein [Bacteroidia bacterium]